MFLRTNTIDTESVRSVTEDGSEWLVAPTILATAMRLNGGYLPTREIKKSAADWDGTPVPIGHPTANGQPVSVENPDAAEPVIGEVRNAEARDDGKQLVGEMWVNVANARAAGADGEAILTRLRNGEGIDVSTAYFPGDVVRNETFDGEVRERAVVDISPDHLAILPNTTGKCSLDEHGCGVGEVVSPAANSLFIEHLPADDGTVPEDQDRAADGAGDEPVANKSKAGVTFSGTKGGDLDESEIPDDDFEDHYLVAGDSKSDSSFPVVDADGNLRRGNVESAWNLRGHAGDKSSLASKLSKLNDEFDDPPIDSEQNMLGRIANAIQRFAGPGVGRPDRDSAQTATMAAEPAVEPSDSDDPVMNDDAKIEWLAENTAYDRENLESWAGEDCLTRLFNAESEGEAPVANDSDDAGTDSDDADADTTDDTDSTMSDTSTDTDDTEYVTADEFEQRMDELGEKIEANSSDLTEDDVREIVDDRVSANEKQDLIDEVAANTDHDAEELADWPEAALKSTLEANSQPQANTSFAGQRGASASPSTNADDDDEDPIQVLPGGDD